MLCARALVHTTGATPHGVGMLGTSNVTHYVTPQSSNGTGVGAWLFLAVINPNHTPTTYVVVFYNLCCYSPAQAAIWRLEAIIGYKGQLWPQS
jgi:hypothetical protein